MGPEYWDELVASTVRGRRWIAAFDYLAGLDRFAQRMIRHGAEALFIVAGARGTGDLPVAGFASWRMLGIGGANLMDGIRRYEAALLDLPPEVVAAIDDFDPDRSAGVLRNVFAVDHPVAGRASYGARPVSWVNELESKITVDELWDAAGVARAASSVVRAQSDELVAAAAVHDQGAGTVWAGDNKGGWHGGASQVRWVRDEESAAAAAAFFAKHCDEVRVMPFLDGIPSSIHGMVVGDDVIAFRPVELVILRRPHGGEFLYAGAATSWDPPDADRQFMRRAALDLGAHLRDQFSYRGAFNLDGVMTAEGWLPTELNARFSAGFGTVAGGFDAPMYHLHLTMVEGEELDYQPRELERRLTEAADADRRGGFGAPLEGLEVGEPRKAGVVFEPDGPRLTLPGEGGEGELTLGPMAAGGYLRFTIDEPVIGESVAPLAAQVMAMADSEWGTGIGAVAPAPDLR